MTETITFPIRCSTYREIKHALAIIFHIGTALFFGTVLGLFTIALVQAFVETTFVAFAAALAFDIFVIWILWFYISVVCDVKLGCIPDKPSS